MTLTALGYLGFHAETLDDWASYGTSLLGLQLAENTGGELAFRMDDRKQRLIIQNGADKRPIFGWEVANAADLDALAARLDAAGVAVTAGSAALASQRRVTRLITFNDPGGNRLEVFYGAEVSTAPFAPGRAHSGFKAGTLGLGHIVLNCTNMDVELKFYTETLGFKLSDYMTKPFRAMFFHINPRHHSLALVEWPTQGIHHLMLEMFMLDDVGQGYDLAQREPGRVATTLGRHTNDYMTSFYTNSPSGFLVESGWGGRTIDPAQWQVAELTGGPSFWGHDRNWLTPEGRELAAQMRMKMARENKRAPVQVTAGNYEVTAGTCAWWDAAKQAAE